MFAPREAQEDRYIITAAIAVIIAVSAFVVLQISFYNGLRYALVQIEQSESVAKVTEVEEGGESLHLFDFVAHFEYKGPQGGTYFGHRFVWHSQSNYRQIGAKVDVIYNPNVPSYYMFPEDLESYRVDLWMALVFVCVLVLSLIIIAITFMKYVRFKQKMRFY